METYFPQYHVVPTRMFTCPYYITDEEYFTKFYPAGSRSCECCHTLEGAGGEFGNFEREKPKYGNLFPWYRMVPTRVFTCCADSNSQSPHDSSIHYIVISGVLKHDSEFLGELDYFLWRRNFRDRLVLQISGAVNTGVRNPMALKTPGPRVQNHWPTFYPLTCLGYVLYIMVEITAYYKSK
ncbi:hypothetical protein BDD12DRAFT_87375 [Trichophaea hybrida]|nr:hypothetical protein BDD12DRAFT_87375 [Trichophaea hybrida]